MHRRFCGRRLVTSLPGHEGLRRLLLVAVGLGRVRLSCRTGVVLLTRHITCSCYQTQAFSLLTARTATKRQANPSHDVTYYASHWSSVSVQPHRKLLEPRPKAKLDAAVALTPVVATHPQLSKGCKLQASTVGTGHGHVCVITLSCRPG